MELKYIATIYSKEEVIVTRTGNDIEQLYIWIMLQLEDCFGDIRGEIVDCKTDEIVKTVNKSIVE
ncbi:MAG: hypothetical protein Q8M03_11180 [Legionella sp.]|nr:hypothetical protein [Legionella sp.]